MREGGERGEKTREIFFFFSLLRVGLGVSDNKLQHAFSNSFLFENIIK
jgi:hypothetical protein